MAAPWLRAYAHFIGCGLPICGRPSKLYGDPSAMISAPVEPQNQVIRLIRPRLAFGRAPAADRARSGGSGKTCILREAYNHASAVGAPPKEHGIAISAKMHLRRFGKDSCNPLIPAALPPELSANDDESLL